ncbi:MAG: universal stress protein [Bacteroidetes bacterium]|nr:universal stress protein [Bacteroidota bacterium]
MWTLTNLLVPTDFSNHSELAIKIATQVAKPFGSQLEILHVTDFEKQSADYAGYKGSKESLIKVIQNEAELKVNKLVKERDWGGLKVVGINIVGTAIERIVHVARQRKTGLVLMATRGRGNATDFVLGSTTYKVIRTAPCPVLSIPNPKNEFKVERILFPTDFSNNSYLGYEYAVSMARHWNAQLNILHVADQDTPDLEVIEQKFTALKSAAFAEGVINVVTHLTKDRDASDGIKNFTDSKNMDLIVIATHGHGGVKQYFLGSTTVDVVTRSAVPVLLIRQYEY